MQRNERPSELTEGMDSWLQRKLHGVRLGERSKRVVRVIAGSPAFAASATAAHVARRAGVNSSTVVRVAQSAGFNGWPDMQHEIAVQRLSSLDAQQLLREHSVGSDSYLQKAVQADIASLQMIGTTVGESEFDAFSESLLKARRIALLGSGSFLGPLIQFAHVGARLGLDVVLAMGEGRSVPATFTNLAKGDALLVLNLWRTPRDVESIVELAHWRNAIVLLISDTQESPLTPYAAQTLVIPAEGSSHFPSLVGATTLVHALLSKLTHDLGGAATESIRRHEETYRQLERSRRE